MNQEEIWKDIPNYEGLYQVSNMGRVKSLPRLHNAIHPYMTEEVILRPRIAGKGKYAAVVLHDKKRGLKKQAKIHQLVAQAFISNPNAYTEVKHINEDKWDNRVENLEWCSRSYNVNYGNRIKKQRVHLIQPVEMLDDGMNVVKTFDSQTEAREYVNGSSGNISKAIKYGRKYNGYYWRKKV